MSDEQKQGWYVTTKTPKPTIKNGVSVCKTYAFLRHSSNPARVFQELSGPTAEQSLTQYAEQLNKMKKVPPKLLPKVAADGVKLSGK